MGIPKGTREFQLWLEDVIGEEWFEYIAVNVRKNTFFLRIRDEDGDDLYLVWSRGEMRYMGGNRVQAEKEYRYREE